MKKLLIGLTLLVSISAFANDYQRGETLLIIKSGEGRRVLIDDISPSGRVKFQQSNKYFDPGDLNLKPYKTKKSFTVTNRNKKETFSVGDEVLVMRNNLLSTTYYHKRIGEITSTGHFTDTYMRDNGELIEGTVYVDLRKVIKYHPVETYTHKFLGSSTTYSVGDTLINENTNEKIKIVDITADGIIKLSDRSFENEVLSWDLTWVNKGYFKIPSIFGLDSSYVKY